MLVSWLVHGRWYSLFVAVFWCWWTDSRQHHSVPVLFSVVVERQICISCKICSGVCRFLYSICCNGESESGWRVRGALVSFPDQAWHTDIWFNFIWCVFSQYRCIIYPQQCMCVACSPCLIFNAVEMVLDLTENTILFVVDQSLVCVCSTTREREEVSP